MLGFELTSRLGDQAAFVSAAARDDRAVPHGSPLPDATAPARALRALVERSYPIEGVPDPAVSEAIYLHDPDGNGIELY